MSPSYAHNERRVCSVSISATKLALQMSVLPPVVWKPLF